MMDRVITSSCARARTALAACAAAGLAAAVAACGSSASSASQPASSPASGALSASAAAPTVTAAAPSATASTVPEASALPPGGTPAGYQRIGGPAQGLSVAVPSSWVTVNLSQQSIAEAIKKIGLRGANQATLAQTLQALQKLQAVYATSPGNSTNVNAYCTNSGLAESGSASVPLVRRLAATELQRLGALNLTQTDTEIGGVPGVTTSYTLSTSGAGTLHAAQLEVLPRAQRACFVTMTAAGPLPSAALAELAPSVKYL
jgi:hypothetical protein